MQNDFTENLSIKILYNSSDYYERFRINFNYKDEVTSEYFNTEISEKIVNHESYREIQKILFSLDHDDIEVEIYQKYGSLILWLNNEEGKMFKFMRINLDALGTGASATSEKYKCEDNDDLENAFNEMVKKIFLFDRYIKEFNYQT